MKRSMSIVVDKNLIFIIKICFLLNSFIFYIIIIFNNYNLKHLTYFVFKVHCPFNVNWINNVYTSILSRVFPVQIGCRKKRWKMP